MYQKRKQGNEKKKKMIPLESNFGFSRQTQNIKPRRPRKIQSHSQSKGQTGQALVEITPNGRPRSVNDVLLDDTLALAIDGTRVRMRVAMLMTVAMPGGGAAVARAGGAGG